MPEFHNPDFQTRNSSGGGALRSLLAFTMLALMVLFIHRYFSQLTPVAPPPVNPAQSQRMQLAQPVSPAPPVQPALLPPRVQNQTAMPAYAKPLYLALLFFHDHGVRNWGWAIIVSTILLNLLMFWPRMMSMNSSLKMMRVQPQVEALKKRYAHLQINDPRRAEMNAEMRSIYKAEGANMYGGCLPLLLQMPLLFAFLRVLQNAVELRHAQWFWLTDLSLPDPFHILPILIIGSMFFTQFITPSPGMDRTQRRMLAILMPVIFGFSLWRSPSGLALYWATGNLINLLIQMWVNRSKMGREMHALAVHRANTPAHRQ